LLYFEIFFLEYWSKVTANQTSKRRKPTKPIMIEVESLAEKTESKKISVIKTSRKR